MELLRRRREQIEAKEKRASGEMPIATCLITWNMAEAPPVLQRFRLFGQLPGRNKLKDAGSRLLVSPFPEIKFILSCCGVL